MFALMCFFLNHLMLRLFLSQLWLQVETKASICSDLEIILWNCITVWPKYFIILDRTRHTKKKGKKKIAQTANYSLSSDDDFITSTTFHKKEVCEMWNSPDWLGFVVWSEVACIDWHSDPTSFRSRSANKRIIFFKHFLITFYIFPPSDQQPLPTWLKKKKLSLLLIIFIINNNNNDNGLAPAVPTWDLGAHGSDGGVKTKTLRPRKTKIV